MPLKFNPTTGKLDLVRGVNPLRVGAIQFDTTHTSLPSAPGLIQWNSVDGTYDMGLLNSSVLQVGQEMMFFGKAQGAISNGDVCEFAGVQGDHILIKKAVGSEIEANPHYLVGVATENIANGNFGYVTWFGKVNDIYTKTPANQDSADWVAGDILYFNNVTGQMTKTMPSVPNRIITIAAVIKEQAGASETGKIIVRPTVGNKLQDLDDVNGTPLTADGQFPVWNNTGKYFDFTSKTGDFLNIDQTTPQTTVGRFVFPDIAVDTNLIYTDSTNNRVGIGTANPTRKLAIFGGDEDTLQLDASIGENAVIYSQAGVLKWEQRVGANFDLYSYTKPGWVFDINGTTGNVGIGTTNPGFALDVQGNGPRIQVKSTGTGYALLQASSAGYSGDIYFGRENSVGGALATGSTGYSGVYNVQGNNPSYFAVNNNIVMTMLSGGNVGIGTTAPGAKLDISAPNTTNPLTLNVASGGVDSNRALNFNINGTTYGKILVPGGADAALAFWTGGGASNSERMRITMAGNVGIGTSTPNATLQVVGNSHFGEDTTNYSEFEADGTLILHGTATTYEDLTSPALSLKILGTGISVNASENTLDFATNADYTDDYVYTSFQMSHTKMLDTNINLHIHWEQTESRLPNFLFSYRWQSQCNEKTTVWTLLPVTTSACAFAGTTLNQISYGAEIGPPRENLSDILQIRLYRDSANDSGRFSRVDNYTTTAKVVFIDVHYRRDSLGSRDEFNK
jgi:hypothetical protein